MTLDTLIPLRDAARKFGLAEASLRALVDKGKIKAGILPNGEIVVSEKDTQAKQQALAAIQAKPAIRKEDLPEYKKHAHLQGQRIWLNEASRKYQVSHVTITRWVSAGYIKRLSEDGYKVFVDEADVAYCAEVYHQRRGQGKWLFNRDGTPYKHKTAPLTEK